MNGEAYVRIYDDTSNLVDTPWYANGNTTGWQEWLFTASTPGNYKLVLGVREPEAYHSNHAVAYFDGNAMIGAAVPLPAAFWLFGTGLLGLLGIRRRMAAG